MAESLHNPKHFLNYMNLRNELMRLRPAIQMTIPVPVTLIMLVKRSTLMWSSLCHLQQVVQVQTPTL